MKLYYFDIYGRAEPIRMLASYAKLPLENIIVTHDSLQELKTQGILEFGQVPVLVTEDGKHYSQSVAILRFLGRQNGFYPDDALAAYNIDSTLDSLEDFVKNYFKFHAEQDAEKKAANKESFLTKFLPAWLDAIEKRISANSTQKYIVGDKITIADFALAGFGFSFILNEANPYYAEVWEVVKDREVLKAYASNLKE